MVFYGATTFTLGAGTVLVLIGNALPVEGPEEMQETLKMAKIVYDDNERARNGEHMTVESASNAILQRSNYSILPKAVGRT